MKIFALVLAATAATASITPEPCGIRVENQKYIAFKDPIVSNLPGKSIRCGGQDPRHSIYDVSTIQSTALAAFQHVLDNTIVGPNRYPHLYGYRDPTVIFPEAVCKHGDDLFEFPILTHGIYNGEDAANYADRVVFKKKSKSEAQYCGLITHIGAPPEEGVAAPFTSCSG